jgi:hypothetical protein
MASRRNLKKLINSEIANVIDSCYDIIIESPKSEEKMNKVIDEAVELYDELLGAISGYKSASNTGAYFRDLETKLYEGVEKLSGKTRIF